MKIFNAGNRIVNNYIIETEKGYVVIDTGYAGNYIRFSKKLQKFGIDKKDIRFIFITHVHADHVGFLNELINDTDATIILHKESPERLLLGHNNPDGSYSNLLAKIFEKCLKISGIGKHTFPVVKFSKADSVVLWDDKEQYFKKSGIGLEIISLPGHTSDSVGLLTDDGILFCGDACMNNFLSINRNIIWIENPDEYKKSWDKMIESSAISIYPSHGSPFPKKDLIKYRKKLEKLNLHKTGLTNS